MEKPNHYWKWYFDVLKASGENNLAFRCCAKSVGLFPATLDPAWKEPSDKPLSTTEHLKLIETYLYTPRYSHISPIHLRRCIRRKQRPTDSDGQQEILFSMYVEVNMALIHHFGKTLKGKILFTWHFWDIKISKPPYVPFPKMVGFCHFLWIGHLSRINYNWQSFWITLYQWISSWNFIEILIKIHLKSCWNSLEILMKYQRKSIENPDECQ